MNQLCEMVILLKSLRNINIILIPTALMVVTTAQF